jgi:hypothetical protein
MLKTGLKSGILFFTTVALCTCIDPYYPQLGKYKSLLVVEGLITDDNSSYQIKLSRTIQEENAIPERVTDAVVSITDGSGGAFNLNNFGNGIYKSDSTNFIGKVGSIYILHIKTSDGNEYKSEPSQMLPIPGIDSIYYEKDSEITNNQSESQTGIRIYLDSGNASEDSKYFRWEFDETWKFHVPEPKKYDYINDTTIIRLDAIKEFCWKTNKSDKILTGSVISGQTNFIKKEPLVFIASDKSDRLTIQYSILVKQYSVSKKEFDFWNNLKLVNESGGDIFDTQPYAVISNISCVNNPDDRVLGYFQVSAIAKKRIYLTERELRKLYLPHFQYDCTLFVVSPEDYPPAPFHDTITFNELYDMFMVTFDYTFVAPVWEIEGKTISKLIFITNACSDCEMTGTAKKPDFWIDL